MRKMLMVLALVAGCVDETPAPPQSGSNTVDLFCKVRRACAGTPEENSIVMMSATSGPVAEREIVGECEAEVCSGALACAAKCCPVGTVCE